MSTYIVRNGKVTGEFSNPRSPNIAERVTRGYSTHGSKMTNVVEVRCLVCGAEENSLVRFNGSRSEANKRVTAFRKAHKHD